MPKKFGIFLTLIATYITVAVFLPTPAHAALVPACSATGACGVCDILGTAITLGKWFVMGAAGLALVVIVNAGVTMALSAGNPEKIGAAKKGILGAVIGLGAVLIAFQFVSIIVFLVVTPSSYQTFEASQESTEANKARNVRASLTSFLGVPWWSICNQNELVAAGASHEKDKTYKGTAVCTYWGNDAACGNNKICCRGACITGEPGHKDASGKWVESTCEPYIQVSAQRAALATQPASPTSGAGGQAGGPAVCNVGYNPKEQQARDRITSIGGIGMNNGGVSGGQSCGTASFKDYRKSCSEGCTNVGSLQDKIFGYLKTIKDKCGSFIITGGSELGHTVGGAHDNGLGVDIRPSDGNYSYLGNCLKRGINDKSLSFIRQICTQSGMDAAYRYNCDYNEAERHLHLSFN